MWLIAIRASKAVETRPCFALLIAIVPVHRPSLEVVIAKVGHEDRCNMVEHPSVAHSPILLAIILVHDWGWENSLISI